jgi:hypothetical protein
MAWILGVTTSVLKYHDRILDARPSAAGTAGKRGLIAQTQLAELATKIQEAYQNRRPWIITEVTHFLQAQVKKPLDRNTVHHILARDPRIKSRKEFQWRSSAWK